MADFVQLVLEKKVSQTQCLGRLRGEIRQKAHKITTYMLDVFTLG